MNHAIQLAKSALVKILINVIHAIKAIITYIKIILVSKIVPKDILKIL